MWIAQISDTHLRPEGVLYGGVVDPAAALATAVAQLDALDPAPDLVLHTGDVTEGGSAEEYALARKLLAGLPAPLRAIPGNHDERDAFRRAFSDVPRMPGSGPISYVDAATGPVRIVALDVTVPGRHHGEVTAEGLAWLDATLAIEPERPTLLMMHQAPLRTAVPYIDEYACRGGEALHALLRRFPAVRLVACGHVHRMMLRPFGAGLLCTAPSVATAIALQPRPDAVAASFLEPPGFLLHHWQGDEMLTHLVPLGTFPGPFPFA